MKVQLFILLCITTIYLTSSEILQFPQLPKSAFTDKIAAYFKPSSTKQPRNIKNSPFISENFISVPIDHFNPLDTRTFEYFYARNDEFASENGPFFIFLYTQSLDDYGFDYLFDGPIYDLAAEFNGTVVVPHHRYYGFSRVFDNLTTENLSFLTTNQAIEDLARISTELRSDRPQAPIILVGSDLGGSLAIWTAQKYPHLITGIWASGAKLHPGLNQPEPVAIVEQQLRDFGLPGCVERIENAFRNVDEMIANNQSHAIRRRFNMCFPIPYQNGDLDIQFLNELLTIFFYQLSLMFEPDLIEQFSCGFFMNADVEHDWEALGYILGLTIIPFPICYPNSFTFQLEHVIEATDANAPFSYSRAFFYQECIEYGFFYNSGNGSSIFGSKFPSEFFAHACEMVFGITEEQMTENYNRFITMHGGRRPVVRNAFITQGEVNPWFHQGFDPTAIHETSTFELIPLTSLRAELSITIYEPEHFEVRRRASEAIRRWIS